MSVDARLRSVLAIHFDPERGSPYWLARAEELGFDPRTEVGCVADLGRFGFMDPDEFSTEGLERFLPRALQDRKSELIVAQTGGTMGRPVWTAYQDKEFLQAFVEPFVVAGAHLSFPTHGEWLYVGPCGPHIIGRAADAIARATGSMSPFKVDFDPRWARKLRSGSFASERYLKHVVDQALAIIASQSITSIFSTPVVIRALSNSLRSEQRARFLGIHYGGMVIASAEMEYLQTEGFPNAVHMSGYGNTLFGCCLELSRAPGRTLRYYPHGDRLVFGVLDPSACEWGREVATGCGVEGALVFSRLDETILLINVIERDYVRLCAPPTDAPEGFMHMGIESPKPRVHHVNVSRGGLY